MKVEPAPGALSHADGAAEHVDDLLDDPEPEADPPEVPAVGGALEPAEDPLLVAGRDAEPLIADDEPRVSPLRPDADVDRLAVPVLDRVRDQVRHDLLEPLAIPAADGALPRVDGQPAAEARRLVDEPRADLARDLGQIDRVDLELELAGRQARDVEQVVDEAAQARRLRVDLLDLGDEPRPLRPGVEARQPKQVRHLQLERRERRAQLVRGDREEVVAQMHRLPQEVLGLLLVVDVGRGGDPAEHRAGVVTFGDGADQVPAKEPVAGASEPHLSFEGRLPAQATLPVDARLVAIVHVEHLPERPVGQTGRVQARSTPARRGSSS